MDPFRLPGSSMNVICKVPDSSQDESCELTESSNTESSEHVGSGQLHSREPSQSSCELSADAMQGADEDTDGDEGELPKKDLSNMQDQQFFKPSQTPKMSQSSKSEPCELVKSAKHSVPSKNKSCKLEGCKILPAEANSRCSQCKLVHYCTRVHQRIDWPRHKPECVAASTASSQMAKPEPSEEPPPNRWSWLQTLGCCTSAFQVHKK